MKQQLTIQPNERRELILLNPTDLTLHITQQASSHLILHLININQESADNHITISQSDQHCTTELYGIGLLNQQQVVSNTTLILHEHPYGTSRQIYKYIAADNARASFYGTLQIQPHAQHADAQQTNRNILLSDTARITTQPQLLIYADDVKASHGATTGQLDPTAIFYMQQRGISAEHAKLLLLNAFLTDVTAHIEDPNQQEKVNQLIAERINAMLNK